MMDVGTEIYKLIKNDDELKLLLPSDHVFQYHVPEDFVEKSPIVRIHPIDMRPSEYADNKQLAFYYLCQIDVWADRMPFLIAQRINKLMKTINLKQSTPIFLYDPDTSMYRDGRRYEGNILIKENDING